MLKIPSSVLRTTPFLTRLLGWGGTPKEKLAPGDRLIQPAVWSVEVELKPTYLATGIAAALLYDNPDDEQAVAMSGLLNKQGLDVVLEDVCELPIDSSLAQLIKAKNTTDQKAVS